MKTRTRNALLLICVISGIVAASLWPDSKPMTESEIATQDFADKPMAPTVVLPLLQGPKQLSEFRGKVVLLNFWATWCAPCIAEMPKQLELVASLPQDVIMIAVASDDSDADIIKFTYKLPTYAQDILKSDQVFIALDKDRSVTQDTFQTLRLPETIIIDPQGRMVRKIVGDSVDWNAVEMKDFLLALAK